MVINKLSKITGILNKLKFIYLQTIILPIYTSLFVSHIKLWIISLGYQYKSNFPNTENGYRDRHYIAHTEPLLDMISLKIIQFIHKLAHNELPPYFKVYETLFSKIVTPYNLRAHPLHIPPVRHIYAES